MRLIDADDLNGYELGLISPKAQKLFHKIINDAPTVKSEPKVGHWEWNQYDGNPKIGNFQCSQCYGIGRSYYDYCPNCGAKMDVSDINVGDKAESEG